MFTEVLRSKERTKERKTERQRDGETERQRDRETVKQRDSETETERQRDRETERQRDRETERKREREKERKKERKKGKVHVFLRILGRGINFRGKGLFVCCEKKDLSEKQINTDQINFLGQINDDDDDHNGKRIGPECVLVGLCLVLFHSVGHCF